MEDDDVRAPSALDEAGAELDRDCALSAKRSNRAMEFNN